jgi:hypothetical protein
MKIPFHWSQIMPNESEERNIVEQQESQGVIEFSQSEENEMYISSIRSCAQHEAMEDLYRGSTHDIKEDSMIAVLETKNSHRYPF